MRKIILFAATCISLAACTKSEINTPAFKKGQAVTISATAGMSESTKVTGTDNGTQIDFKWEEGDKVLVKVGEASSEFTIKSGTISADGKSADFEGTMPAEGSSYDVQYPVPSDTDPLKNQTYVEGGIASGLMQFGATGCTSSRAELKAKTMILQLNLYTRAETEDYVNPLTPLDSIVVDYTYKLYTNCRNKLNFSQPIDMPTTEAEAIPFYIVVPVEDVASLHVTCYAYIKDETRICQLSITDTNPIAAGTCLNMPACQISWSSCLAAGTRITMADGSTKKVEDIVEGDIIRTFDHEAGCISSAKVCLAMQEEGQMRPLNLHFASGNTLTVAGQHGLIEQNSRKYVLIHSGNIQKYVGKCFYNANSASWDKLESYDFGATPVDRYAIYSAKHLNFIAENMLTVEDDVDFLLNIYELDANLKADVTQLAADIAKYGLCDIARDFPEFAQYQSQMEDLGCKYVYIAIGKGLIPESYIETRKSYWMGK